MPQDLLPDPDKPQQDWAPPDEALELHRIGEGRDGRRIVVAATHPAHPFEVNARTQAPDAREFGALAFGYLQTLQARFERQYKTFLPEGWMDALAPKGGSDPVNPALAWLPIDNAAPIASRRFERGSDRTVVLLAGSDFSSDHFGRLRAGFGLRIVMHRLPKFDMRYAITSMTAHLPDSQYRDLVQEVGNLIAERGGPFVIKDELAAWAKKNPAFEPYLSFDFLRTAVSKVTGQDPETLSLTEFRPLAQTDDWFGFEFASYGRAASMLATKGEAKQGYSGVMARVRVLPDLRVESQQVARWPLHADASPIDVPVFEQVPAAKKGLMTGPRDTFLPQPNHDLPDALRRTRPVPPVLENGVLRVRYCPDFVATDRAITDPLEGTKDAGDPYEIVLPPSGYIEARSDLQSAISV